MDGTKAVAAVALVSALLAGCVSNQPVNWVRAWPRGNEIYKDRAQCDYEVTAAVQTASPGVSSSRNPVASGIVEGIDIGIRRADLFVRCMQAKGWRRGAPGEVDVQVAAAAMPQSQAQQSAPATVVSKNQTATKWLMQAEQAAKAQQCAQNPLASITATGPGFETYAVPCASGDTMMVRCDVSGCRALR